MDRIIGIILKVLFFGSAFVFGWNIGPIYSKLSTFEFITILATLFITNIFISYITYKTLQELEKETKNRKLDKK